jgi:membrane-associated phospholipid phosphatase
MRTSEWIQGGFAAILAVTAWGWPISVRRRLHILVLAVVAIGTILLVRILDLFFPSEPVAILRDWLPVPLTLIPYWQTGQLFAGPNTHVQDWLLSSDRWLFRQLSWLGWRIGPGIRLTLEWAYSLCYGMAAAGLGVLYAANLRSLVNLYWFFVLVPTYLCYAITPFFPALPPRDLGELGDLKARPKNFALRKSRVFNLWLLKYGSIQAISFPSAHAASSLAIALVLFRYLPVAGWVFLAMAIWIGVAAVAGGYHYAIDVALGSVVALAVFAAWDLQLIPSALFIAPATIFAGPL